MRTFMLCIGALALGFCGAALAEVAIGTPTVDLNLKQLAHPFFYFTAASLIGMVGHAIKKFGAGETSSNPFEWFFADHGRRSFAAVTAAVSTAGFAAITHKLDGLDATQLIYAGIASGVMFDSTINKGAPPPALQ